jgi:hypothetical protein
MLDEVLTCLILAILFIVQTDISNDQAKPAARRGRKVAGLQWKTAGLRKEKSIVTGPFLRPPWLNNVPTPDEE